jgi:hypothetical protein
VERKFGETTLNGYPQGFDLPKTLAECGLLVKYEPESRMAPAITCVRCVALAETRNVWRDPA